MSTTSLLSGTGAHALVVHLQALVDEADAQLVAAPDHLLLFRATLREWRRSIEHDRKLEINRFADSGIDVVTAFGGPIPSPSVLNLPEEEISRRLAGLVKWHWLQPARGTAAGGTTLYRAHRGDVFGAKNT